MEHPIPLVHEVLHKLIDDDTVDRRVGDGDVGWRRGGRDQQHVVRCQPRSPRAAGPQDENAGNAGAAEDCDGEVDRELADAFGDAGTVGCHRSWPEGCCGVAR